MDRQLRIRVTSYISDDVWKMYIAEVQADVEVITCDYAALSPDDTYLVTVEEVPFNAD